MKGAGARALLAGIWAANLFGMLRPTGPKPSSANAKIFARKGMVKVGAHPFGVASGPTPSRWRRGAVFSTGQYGGTVSVFDLATFQPVKRISAGDYPEGIETSAGGNSVYVVNWFLNEIWAIDAGTLAVTAKMPAGDGPRAFGTFLRKAL